MERDLPVVILCGGRGTRLRERTEQIPKPLVEIGGLPILWHVMQIYASQGFHRFLLALGYLGARIKEYFLERQAWQQRDFRLLMGDEQGPIYLRPPEERWDILFVDTGEDTPTGGRLCRLAPFLSGERFLATYADGVADIDLNRLLEFHRRHGGLATVTAVQPQSPFGLMELEESGRVRRFREKPRLDDWVNGGFFAFERSFLERLGPDSVLEREPLEQLAAGGDVFAYRHQGFWACMDTFKDAERLNGLWNSGEAPWRIW